MDPVQQLFHISEYSDILPNQNNLLDLIKNRRSIRKYQKKKPELSEIDRIINCAVYAPSAHNAQPWRFLVISDEKKKTALIEKMAARFRHELERDNTPEEVIRRKTQRSVHLFSSAPVIIIACVDMTGMDRYPDVTRQQAERTMAIQSLAAAIQKLLLAAKAVGLGGCWYCAPLFCPDIVKTVLSLSDCLIPQALITLGYPEEDPPTPPRFRLDEIRFTL